MVCHDGRAVEGCDEQDAGGTGSSWASGVSRVGAIVNYRWVICHDGRAVEGGDEQDAGGTGSSWASRVSRAGAMVNYRLPEQPRLALASALAGDAHKLVCLSLQQH